jgi:hypothetical protein
MKIFKLKQNGWVETYNQYKWLHFSSGIMLGTRKNQFWAMLTKVTKTKFSLKSKLIFCLPKNGDNKVFHKIRKAQH